MRITDEFLNAADFDGVDPSGAFDSTDGLNNVLGLAANPWYPSVVFLPRGIYRVSAPIVIPPGVTLRGEKSNTLSLTDSSTVIKASTTWARSGAAGAGMILLLSQTAGGYSGTSEEQKLFDLMLEGQDLTGTVDGILVIGNVGSVTIRDVNISRPSGVGFHGIADSGSNNPSGVWEVTRLSVHRAGTNGINFTATDSTWMDCYVIGSGQKSSSDGWVIGTSSNSQWIGCRSEDSVGGNGFTYTCSNAAGNGVNFVGCSTQGNANYGFALSAMGAGANAAPVSFTGCRFNEDGVNGGSGGGGYASMLIGAYASTIAIDGCLFVPGNQFTTGAPDYGIKVATAAGANVLVSGCHVAGMLGYQTSDGTANLSFSNSVLQVGRGGSSPAVYVPNTKLVAASVAAAVPTATEDLLGAISGALAVSIPRWFVTSNTISTSSGQGYFRQIILPAGVTVTNLALRVGSTAKTGGTHGWYALCDKNFKVLAVSTDQTDAATTWGTINTDQALAVTTNGSAKYITTYSGVYYIVFCVVQSAGTQPNFCGGASIATGLASVSPLLFGTCAGASNTTPPAVGSTIGTLAGIAGDDFYAYVS